MERCRFDSENYKEIRDLFFNNLNLFKVIDIRNINGKKVTFSHSYIGSKWINNTKVFEDKSIEGVVSLLNNSLHANDQDIIYKSLSQISRYRGGYSLYGSVVWSDIFETHDNDNEPSDIDYQIFGHTQHTYLPTITKRFACLDIREGFYIDNGIIINEKLKIHHEI